MLTFKEILKQDKDRASARVYCKKCGHSMVMPSRKVMRICKHCGTATFKNQKDEFTYKLREKIIREKREKNERRKNENL